MRISIKCRCTQGQELLGPRDAFQCLSWWGFRDDSGVFGGRGMLRGRLGLNRQFFSNSHFFLLKWPSVHLPKEEGPSEGAACSGGQAVGVCI